MYRRASCGGDVEVMVGCVRWRSVAVTCDCWSAGDRMIVSVWVMYDTSDDWRGTGACGVPVRTRQVWRGVGGGWGLV